MTDLDEVAAQFEALLDYEFRESYRGDVVAFAAAIMSAVQRARCRVDYSWPPARALPAEFRRQA